MQLGLDGIKNRDCISEKRKLVCDFFLLGVLDGAGMSLLLDSTKLYRVFAILEPIGLDADDWVKKLLLNIVEERSLLFLLLFLLALALPLDIVFESLVLG